MVVAAGSGSRFGGPKQFQPLGERRVVDWAVAAAREACDGVVAVVPPGADVSSELDADVVVEGAPSRPGSVRRGLGVLPAEADIVVVHDAARPLAPPRLFTAVVAAVRSGADGGICAVPIHDTVKRVEGDVVVHTLDRRGLWAVQTPQAFLAPALRRAHAGEPEASDDAALVEMTGGRVVVVQGEARNLKVTGPEDLALAEALLVTLG